MPPQEQEQRETADGAAERPEAAPKAVPCEPPGKERDGTGTAKPAEEKPKGRGFRPDIQGMRDRKSTRLNSSHSS